MLDICFTMQSLFESKNPNALALGVCQINRWQAIEKIEQKELQSTSLIDNAIKQRANRLGIIRETDDGEMQVFLLWAKLKANYIPN